jgi:SagB-type dehydrogenase family enzyme
MLRLTAVCVLAIGFAAILPAQDLKPVDLPPPDTSGGRPLMQVLKERKTVREFRRDALTPQQLSDLLWATWGINRPENSHRTAPSAMNCQELDLYVAMEKGLFLYDAKAHKLTPVSANDVRGQTGSGPIVQDPPLQLIFVADFARAEKMKTQKEYYSAMDTGFLSQNAYLYCASAGLGSVVHEVGNRVKLAEAMGLRPDQKVTIAQAVGHPKPSPGSSR